MRQMSGRFFGRKRYHASLLILEAVGGALEEDADKAVLGAVDAVERIEKDRWDVRDKILEQLTDEQKSAADEVIEKLGPTRKLLDVGLRWRTEKRYPEARRVLNDLSFAEKKELRDAAQEARKELDAAWVADVPPEDRALVDGVIENAAWGRTSSVTMQEFILIGPRGLIESIPAGSRRRFDVAYVFLTDLFGRRPNPAGDRVTVYFKELWEFGGGTGGGKQINIGRAAPEKRGTRLDTGLLYHELTHCIDDTRPVLGGWHEGLANVGAAYAFEVLGQRADLAHSFAANLRDFRNDYVARDLAYWRIPNYGPSAGFFLYFVDTYARTSSPRSRTRPFTATSSRAACWPRQSAGTTARRGASPATSSASCTTGGSSAHSRKRARTRARACSRRRSRSTSRRSTRARATSVAGAR